MAKLELSHGLISHRSKMCLTSTPGFSDDQPKSRPMTSPCTRREQLRASASLTKLVRRGTRMSLHLKILEKPITRTPQLATYLLSNPLRLALKMADTFLESLAITLRCPPYHNRPQRIHTLALLILNSNLVPLHHLRMRRHLALCIPFRHHQSIPSMR